ncbi:AAA family ATPase [Pseudarthrobacter scleromae]|uniref:AAA family ATPase n=1 Tax=Pseudarthrobacter scleromae TaxID=158897 RepID=UPI00362C04BD
MTLGGQEWLVRGLISASLTVVSGKPKSGKSALVLNLATSILLDRQYLGDC